MTQTLARSRFQRFFANRCLVLGGVSASAILLSASAVNAQIDEKLDAAERAAVAERIGELLNDRYVFPEIAAQCAQYLAEQHMSGAFDEITDPVAFAERLTEAVH